MAAPAGRRARATRQHGRTRGSASAARNGPDARGDLSDGSRDRAARGHRRPRATGAVFGARARLAAAG